MTLQLPQGWTSDPEARAVKFTREDESATVTFMLQPPVAPASGEAVVKAIVRTETGARSEAGYQVVESA